MSLGVRLRYSIMIMGGSMSTNDGGVAGVMDNFPNLPISSSMSSSIPCSSGLSALVIKLIYSFQNLIVEPYSNPWLLKVF